MGNVRRLMVGAMVTAAVAAGPSSVPVDTQTAAPPILLVTNSAAANPFGTYLAEILRAEGITAFAAADLSTVTAGTLAAHRLVVLAETTLTSGQASLFNSYVAGGGRLVAMRPDPQLFTTLGISSVSGTTSDGYLLIDQAGPGAGLQTLTLPIKGTASHYALTTAASAAALYANSTTTTGRPAVAVGARTAAWAFDLARSVAYVRQGNPAFANADDDPVPINRTIDVFYGRIDRDRVSVPHADVQMRLFTRVVESLLATSTPLPKLWYFPGTSRTIVLPTADSHTSDVAPFQALLNAAESYGARVSLYLARWTSTPSDSLVAWRAAGHEVGLHPYFTNDGFAGNMNGGYTLSRDWWQSLYAFPYSPTIRHHSLEWTGWVDPALTMQQFGIRMDTSYYTWGPTVFNPSQQQQAHGYINGSGLPMRFITQTGQVVPVYQQVTSLVDEQLVTGGHSEGLTIPQALAVSRQLIDDSQAGGYSAIASQFHVDYYQFGEVGPWVDGTMQYAQSQQVPMWTMRQWLEFVEARAATAVANVSWSANDRALTFTAQLPAGSPALTMLVPGTFGGDSVDAVAVDGQSVSAPTLVVNGRSMRAITLTPAANGAARSVAVLYSVPTPTVRIADLTVFEGHAGPATVQVPVTLSSPSSNTVTVGYATADGTAVQPGDYQAASGTVTFAPFQTTASIPVAVVGDLTVEPNEAFSLTLNTPANATIDDGVGIVTLTDDDAPPTIAVTDVSVTEPDSGTTAATFAVTLSHASGNPVTVQYATADGTATAGSDYTAGSGTLTFNPGVTSLPIGVPVIGEQAAEPDETFTVNLSNPTNGIVGDPQGVGTIVNEDDGTVTLTASFPIVAGGDDVNEDGTAFTPDSTGVWVGTGGSTTASFAGFRFANVTIPAGATIQSARLEMRSSSSQWLSINFEFAMVAAANPAPFSPASRPSQHALLPPRVGHATNVQWQADTWYQFEEIGPLVQAAVNQAGWASGNALSLVARGTGQAWARKFAHAFEAGAASAPRLVVTYTFSQGGGAQPTLSIGDAAVTEGNSGTRAAVFTVSLSAPSAQVVSAGWATSNGTATAGSDYVAASGTVSFPANTTTQTVSVTVNGDTAIEPSETFAVTLGAPVNATIADGTAQGTITNDDGLPSLSVNDVTVTEGHAGIVPATFTVRLSAASAQSVSVNYATAAGTAIAGQDFATGAGTVTFAPGTTTRTVVVDVLGDVLDEANETFTVALSAPVNATISDASGSGTITDDDAAPSLRVDDVARLEGNAGTSPSTFTVSLSAPSGRNVTVNYATANGSATAGSDYVAANGSLTFAAGVTTRTVAVTVNGDTTAELNETFTIQLSSAVNATLADAQGLGTITNDDTGVVTSTVTLQVAAGSNDVNQDGTSFSAGSSTVWLGNGSSTTASYTGLRFTNVPVPAGATVTSARLEVNAATTYLLGQSMAFQFAIEASANSAAFSSTARPSQRTLLAPRVNHSSSTAWSSGTWYRLDEIATIVQAAIAQPGWTPGNAMSLILRGTGSSNARKLIRAYEAGSARAARLIVTYSVAVQP